MAAKRIQSVKRILVLWMSVFGYLIQTAIYAVFWLKVYYPIISRPTYSLEGYALGNGLKLYVKGHILVLLIYFILFLFASRTFGGTKVGYLKPLDVFISQVFELIMVNVISYFQISLMNNWLVPVRPMLLLLLIQIAVAALWIRLSDALYRKVFRARELLVIYDDAHPIQDILNKFDSRRDMFEVKKTLNLRDYLGRSAAAPTEVEGAPQDRQEDGAKPAGFDALCRECEAGYGAVVLWDIPTKERNELLKHCYSKSIRVYMMPKIPDVLIQGSTQMHLFDTPILVVRGDYALKTEQRIVKRAIDVVCAVLLAVITSPIMLVTAICIKAYDHGPVLYKQIRCTTNQREFEIMKFRSMRVDAEKDGKAVLAKQHDDRITPVGRFIRKVRIDELPQLFNIIKGDMSFIGPRPERPEIIAQYMKDMPEFAYRMKVKAGLAGYAQVYGKYNTTPYDKLKLDLTYIQNYSIRLDLKLMLLTLKILLQPESTEGVGEDQTTALKQ